jgi:hypothetical protein
MNENNFNNDTYYNKKNIPYVCASNTGTALGIINFKIIFQSRLGNHHFNIFQLMLINFERKSILLLINFGVKKKKLFFFL